MAKEITLNLQGGGTVTLDTDTIRVVSAIPKGSSITTVLPNGDQPNTTHDGTIREAPAMRGLYAATLVLPLPHRGGCWSEGRYYAARCIWC